MLRQAVEYAAVVMSDNSTKKLNGTTSAADGSFTLDAKAGEYILEISLVGYDKYAVTLGVDKDIALDDIVLQEDVKMLAGAKVAANRIEYKNTGYEYKVSSIAALQKLDLSDVLKTAPGLMVTEDRLALYGRDISNIYVDGRRVQLRQNQLIDYLNGFKGDNIDKIEVISDPDISSVHAGTALRITTRKQTGGIASVSARAMGNDNRFVASTSANLTYRRGKMLLYSSAFYMNMASRGEESTISVWKDSDRKETLLTTEKFRLPVSANATVGVGYDISKNDHLSAEVSFRELRRNQERTLRTESTAQDGTSTTDTRSSDYRSISSTPTASVMYTHSFRDASVLTLSSDFVGSYKSTDITGDIAADNTSNNISTFAGYAGWSKNFGKAHGINAGVRYSYIDNESTNGTWSFAYDESEVNPFASYSFSANNIGVAAGVQAHFADIGGKSFTDVVPNASLNYYISRSRGHNLRASYSMGVRRPSMSQMNPNAIFSDNDIIISVGNPELQSYRTNNYGLNLTMFNNYTLSASYTTADKAITSYMYTDDDGNIYQSFVNNAVNREAEIYLFTNTFVSTWLSLMANVGYRYIENVIDGRSRRNNALEFNGRASFTLPKDYSADISFTGKTDKVVAYNATQKEPVIVAVQLNKRINSWRLSFKVNDLFDLTRRGDTIIDLGDCVKTLSRGVSYRTFELSASYNFRWGKAGARKMMQSQKMELSGRIGQ